AKKLSVGFEANLYPWVEYSVLSAEKVKSSACATTFCKTKNHCDTSGAWIKYFGTGTKLVVSGTSISKPTNLQILPPSPVQEGKETYICFFENFYPEVVKATWREGDKRDKVLDSVQADAFKFNETSYSASSWMTVDASDLSKKYTCEIQHEAGSNTIEFLPAGPENQDTPDCIPTPEDSTAVSEDIGGRFTHNTALLVYVVLLLKSTIYYIIILFLVYRMGGLIKPQSKKP
uniref:Ig-like domain-containing protein n=1 Tax=Sphenodon punctatus TaxID=8508 RepID=A0A8D0HQD3_SPHPU